MNTFEFSELHSKKKGSRVHTVVQSEVSDTFTGLSKKFSDEELMFALWTFVFEQIFDSYKPKKDIQKQKHQGAKSLEDLMVRDKAIASDLATDQEKNDYSYSYNSQAKNSILLPRTMANDIYAIRLFAKDCEIKLGFSGDNRMRAALDSLGIKTSKGFFLVPHGNYGFVLNKAHKILEAEPSKTEFVKRMVELFPHPDCMKFKWISNIGLHLEYDEVNLDYVKNKHRYFNKYRSQLKKATGRDPIREVFKTWKRAKKEHHKYRSHTIKMFLREYRKKLKIEAKCS